MLMADRLSIDINALLKDAGIDKRNLNDLTRAEGMILSKKLNELQQIKYSMENNKNNKKEKANANKPTKV